ncbi:MAG: hypothetical protein H7235_03585 [Bdellovibrionaceae bacterium]|nr:hypothetical protein [Pseudobdellovibrionaceae bacterium]
MKTVIYGLIFLLPILGQAEVQKILDITSESDPAALSVISLDVDLQHQVIALAYRPDVNKDDLKTFPVKKVITDPVTIKSEKSVEIVGMRVQKISPTSYIVTLHYLYEFKLFNKTYKDKQLNAAYSSPDNRYLVQDPATKKLVTRLHFISHYNTKGKEVGIERIETL